MVIISPHTDGRYRTTGRQVLDAYQYDDDVHRDTQ